MKAKWWFDETERHMTLAEQAKCDQMDAAYRDALERCPPTPRQRVDMAVANAGGFCEAILTACPWWWLPAWIAVGTAAGWLIKCAWRAM